MHANFYYRSNKQWLYTCHMVIVFHWCILGWLQLFFSKVSSCSTPLFAPRASRSYEKQTFISLQLGNNNKQFDCYGFNNYSHLWDKRKKSCRKKKGVGYFTTQVYSGSGTDENILKLILPQNSRSILHPERYLAWGPMGTSRCFQSHRQGSRRYHHSWPGAKN